MAFNREVHSKFIDRVNTLVDEGGKKVSAELLRTLNVREALSSPAVARKKFIARFIQKSDPLFTQVGKIGKELHKEKNVRPVKAVQ